MYAFDLNGSLWITFVPAKHEEARLMSTGHLPRSVTEPTRGQVSSSESPGEGRDSAWSHRVLEQQHVLCPQAKLPQAPPTGTAAARARHRPYIKRTVAFGLSSSSSSSRELTDGGQYAELNYKWAILTTNTSSTYSHPHLPTASGANNSEDIF